MMGTDSRKPQAMVARCFQSHPKIPYGQRIGQRAALCYKVISSVHTTEMA